MVSMGRDETWVEVTIVAFFQGKENCKWCYSLDLLEGRLEALSGVHAWDFPFGGVNGPGRVREVGQNSTFRTSAGTTDS